MMNHHFDWNQEVYRPQGSLSPDREAPTLVVMVAALEDLHGDAELFCLPSCANGRRAAMMIDVRSLCLG